MEILRRSSDCLPWGVERAGKGTWRSLIPSPPPAPSPRHRRSGKGTEPSRSVPRPPSLACLEGEWHKPRQTGRSTARCVPPWEREGGSRGEQAGDAVELAAASLTARPAGSLAAAAPLPCSGASGVASFAS
jgi:hypothetical protein